jgi:hypothetical protein
VGWAMPGAWEVERDQIGSQFLFFMHPHDFLPKRFPSEVHRRIGELAQRVVNQFVRFPNDHPGQVESCAGSRQRRPVRAPFCEHKHPAFKRLAPEQFQETFSGHRPGHWQPRGLEKCRSQIFTAHQCRVGGSRLHRAGPPDDQRNMDSKLVQGSLSAELGTAIVVHERHQRVSGKAASVQVRHHIPKEPVKVGNLVVVGGEIFPHKRRVGIVT